MTKNLLKKWKKISIIEEKRPKLEKYDEFYQIDRKNGQGNIGKSRKTDKELTCLKNSE